MCCRTLHLSLELWQLQRRPAGDRSDGRVLHAGQPASDACLPQPEKEKEKELNPASTYNSALTFKLQVNASPEGLRSLLSAFHISFPKESALSPDPLLDAPSYQANSRDGAPAAQLTAAR